MLVSHWLLSDNLVERLRDRAQTLSYRVGAKSLTRGKARGTRHKPWGRRDCGPKGG